MSTILGNSNNGAITASTSNGINNLSINVLHGTALTPVASNTLEFTCVASAINTGIEILETPEGRDALRSLGSKVVAEWEHRNPGIRTFSGDPTQMRGYVDFFLKSIRADFLWVALAEHPIDVTAAYERAQLVQWDVRTWQPKRSGNFSFNLSKVNAMVAAAQGPHDKAVAPKMADRYRRFQFLFSVAAAHELTHAFVAYLSGAATTFNSSTPPSVSFLDYGIQQIANGGAGGESGRWFENKLFGGSLECYRDIKDDNGQCGLAHILDEHEVARPISMATMLTVIGNKRTFQFPFVSPGAKGLTPAERQAKQMRRLGAIHHPVQPQAGRSFMQALFEPQNGTKKYRYNVKKSDLLPLGLHPATSVKAVLVK
ncbi:hypothetical protein QBC44DRAFT_396820 [Cladorrhinum sp. PSN332]|nr:hypothetical protein QBC44DRAFT_396820 [Cladorrhinum sp. PSN332]